MSSHGPEFLDQGTVRFRLWAPSAERVEVVLDEQTHTMQRGEKGWFEHTLPAASGDRYAFRINGNERVPDPAARWQPDGIGDVSALDDGAYVWQHAEWKGRPWEEAVIYELHVGTFSDSGTYTGIEEKLEYLKTLGVTAIELMPIATFGGARGWGYDGVLPYAPHPAYGTPQALKHLIDAAHGHGLMVLLDVVYNHFGPDGNYLNVYAKEFFTERYQTPWGAAINFEGAPQVRDFFIDNAVYWLNEFRFDGLRFDAVHAIEDASEKHFLYALAAAVRERTPRDRHIHLILENDKNQAQYLEDMGEVAEGEDSQPANAKFNAQWNDDFHHVMHVLTTGEDAGYYSDYSEETLRQLGRCLAEGFAYQGDPSRLRTGELRGEKSAHLPPTAFVNFLQNHDQIGNRALGERLASLTDHHRLAFATAIALLSPAPPLLFMGEEWAASTPFYYFCDFAGELADAVREGRRKEFAQFPAFSDPKAREKIPDPNAEGTFRQSRLNWEERMREPYHKHFMFVQKLLGLRQQHIVPLLASGWKRSEYRLLDAQGLEVFWYFQDGTLHLVANPSAQELGGIRQSGLHVWGHFGETMPGWKCAFSIEG